MVPNSCRLQGKRILIIRALSIFATDAQQIASLATLKGMPFEDLTYRGVTIAHIAVLEPQFSLEGACIPVLRPVLQLVWDFLARLWPKKWKRRVVDDQRPPWIRTWLSATNRYPSVHISIKIDEPVDGELSPLGDLRCPSGLRNSMLESVSDGDVRKSYPSSAGWDVKDHSSLDIQPV